MGNPQKRVFRIEKYMKLEPLLNQQKAAAPEIAVEASAPVQPAVNDFKSAERHQDILDLLQELKDEMVDLKLSGVKVQESAETGDITTAKDTAQEVIPLSEEEIEEAKKLRSELKEIYDAIERTKVEILTIHQSGVNGMEISRVSDELGAIVQGTEKATETILESAESIDQIAADLVAALHDENHHGLACDIQDKVIKIFESCNFQDLTGQRISKVVSAFGFIEERVIQMMEIWGGVESFADVEAFEREDREGDKALLNGPALDEDDNVASQDDIDALFD